MIGNLDNTLDGLVAKKADFDPHAKRYQTENEAIELPDEDLEVKVSGATSSELLRSQRVLLILDGFSAWRRILTSLRECAPSAAIRANGCRK